MKPNSHEDPHERLVEIVEARQRNTLFPDAMINARGVDELLWKGSPRATKVQRVGIAIWGLLFLGFGIYFGSEAAQNESALTFIFAVTFFAIGLKITLNAFRRSAKGK